MTRVKNEEQRSHGLVRREHVEAALQRDKSASAVLESFTIEDFTAKGDNVASFLTSIKIAYKLNGVDLQTSFVVKLNPLRDAIFDKFTRTLFWKEVGFYTKVLPQLNYELDIIQEPPLGVPRFIHGETSEHREAYYFEDLRRLDFKMADRKLGLTKELAVYVLAEMGRFHAASTLLTRKAENHAVNYATRFPELEEAFDILRDQNSTVSIYEFFPGMADSGVVIAESFEGYEKVAEFLRTNRDSLTDLYRAALKSEDKFRAINHGDCWTNNLLFRYDDTGSVRDCRMLDFQLCRVGSVALDLNLLFYCSLDGHTRRENSDNFFTIYYESFERVVAKAGMPMRFTLAELKTEFREKTMFGFLMGLLLIPMIITDPEDAFQMEDFYGEDMEAKTTEYHEKSMKLLQENPLLKPRLLSLFDDAMSSRAIP